MKKETFLKIAYICLSIMLIALTIGWVISGIDFVIEEVAAEEINDLTILDFNQLYEPTYNKPQTTTSGISHMIQGQKVVVSGTATANVYVNTSKQIDMKANHIYYLSGLSGTATGYNALSIFPDGARQNSEVLEIKPNGQLIKWNNNYLSTIYLQFSNNTTYFGTFYINIIDLSQMFGLGNEPQTIEEIKKILPQEYYSYTTSKLITNKYLDGFNDGAFSMQDGYTIEEVASDLVNTAYPIDIINNEFNKTDNLLAFNGTIALNTKYTLIANDTIILDLEFLGDSTIDIYVQGNNGNYIKLTTIVSNQLPNSYTSGSGYTYYSGIITLKLPVDINTILFKGVAAMQVYNVKYKTFNLSQAIVDSFQNGVNSVDTQAIRDKAFEDGKNWAINHNTDTAWGSSWEFIGSAFSGVGDILSIELLPNIPLWTFIAIPLLFGLIALLYKLVGG